MPQTPKVRKRVKPQKNRLTANQIRFVDALLATNPRNATAAYLKVYPTCKKIAAGYAAASRLVNTPKIAAIIAKHEKNLADQAGLTADRIRVELSLLSFSDVSAYVVDEHGYLAPAPGVPKEVMRAVSSVKRKQRTWREQNGNVVTEHEIEFRLWDKPGALRVSAQHRGMLTEKIEHTGKDGAPLAAAPTKITVQLVQPAA